MLLDAKNVVPKKSYKGGIKGYWKSRGYHRVDGGVAPRPRPNQAQLGGGARRRRSWKINIKPKLGFLRRISPRRFLVRIRDAYVRLMLRIGSSPGIAYGGYDFGGVRFGQQTLKEYDEKVIVEIYKNLVAQRPLLADGVARGAGGLAGGGIPEALRL